MLEFIANKGRTVLSFDYLLNSYFVKIFTFELQNFWTSKATSAFHGSLINHTNWCFPDDPFQKHFFQINLCCIRTWQILVSIERFKRVFSTEFVQLNTFSLSSFECTSNGLKALMIKVWSKQFTYGLKFELQMLRFQMDPPSLIALQRISHRISKDFRWA